jgi:hypothetical protein
MSGLGSTLDARFQAVTSTSSVAGGSAHDSLLGGRRGAGHESSRSVLRAAAKKIPWLQAAEILGVSSRRVPSAVFEEALRLYRECYLDLNVKHFHERIPICPA